MPGGLVEDWQLEKLRALAAARSLTVIKIIFEKIIIVNIIARKIIETPYCGRL